MNHAPLADTLGSMVDMLPLPHWTALAALDDDAVPLMSTALLIARDEYPQLDAELYDTLVQSHVEHLRREVLPGLLAEAAKGRRVRIWSAGCSMGHETYSIALRLLERMPDARSHDIRILATDIDRNVLATARAGRYDAATLKVLTPADLDRGFRPAGPDLFEVRPELRELVAFHELNLLSDWPMRGTFDVVFFRNVAIYFDQGVREAIWLRMAERMPAGGWLYVGHSERVTGEPAALFSHEANTTYRRLAG